MGKAIERVATLAQAGRRVSREIVQVRPFFYNFEIYSQVAERW